MSHSFKLENNVRKNNKKKKSDYSLILMLIFLLIAFGCLIIYFVMNNSSKTNMVEKKDQNKDYVYTYKKIKNTSNESDEVIYDKIPTINLDGVKYSKINKEIIDNYNKIITKSTHKYEYEFSYSKNILSLVIKSTYPNQDNDLYIKTYFNTYNIDLKNDKILSNDEILKIFNVDENKIKIYLNSKFTSYYEDLVKYKYFTKNECNYDCFLNNRGISKNYLDDINYYVDNGKLVLFKFYYRDSKYDEAQYFKDTTYSFLIKK